MNVHDKAYELAKALKESTEYKDMQHAQQLVNKDPEAKGMLDDFRSRQMGLQEKMMSGEMPPQDEMAQMEKQYEVLNLNLAIRRLFESERRLSVIMEDVQRIITEPLQDIFN